MPQTSRAQRRRQPTRSAQSVERQQQRRPARALAEPVDYARDYASVRRDLWRILLWTVVMFVGMGVIYFVI